MSYLRKAITFGLSGWLALALFSILQYPKIVGQACYFGMSWLFCSAHLNVGLRVALVCLLFLIFTCLVCSGFFLWKFYQNREGQQYNKKIVWIAALFIFLASLVVPFASGDVVFYFYAGKAEHAGTAMFVQEWNRENHFVQPPAKLNDKFPYGPITARVFGALYSVSHDNVVIFILLWKVVVGLFFLLSGWLLWKFLDTSADVQEKNNLWLLWLLQPAALFEWMVSGHFDAIWLVFILVALILAQRKKWWLVLPCLVVGIWIKFIPIFFVPWFVVKWWQDVHWQNWKKMLGEQVVGILISVVITILSWGKFWHGFVVFDTISKLSKWAVSSTFAVIYYTLAAPFSFLIGANYHWYLTRFVQFGLLLVVLYFMYPFIKKTFLVIFRKTVLSEVDFLNAFFVSMVVYMIFWQKAVWPWYTTWLLPLGIMAYIKSKNEFVKKITAWITISPLFFYLVWMLNFQITGGGDATMHLWFFYYVVISIFAYPSYYLFKWRRVNYNIEGLTHRVFVWPAYCIRIKNFIYFILRQFYRVFFIFPFLVVTSIIEMLFGKFFRIKTGETVDICFVVSSVIYIKQRELSYTSTSSVYSPEERAAQTVKTIESIREKAPGAKIVLVEVGLQENLPADLVRKVDQYIYLGNKYFVRKASDSKFKSLSEAVMLMYARKRIKFNARVFIKICGRYFLDENFDINLWKTSLFRFFYIREDFVFTRLYSFGSQMMSTWFFAFIKSLPLLLIGYPIEHTLARYIKSKNIIRADKVGLMGADATSGKSVKE